MNLGRPILISTLSTSMAAAQVALHHLRGERASIVIVDDSVLTLIPHEQYLRDLKEAMEINTAFLSDSSNLPAQTERHIWKRRKK